MRHKILMTAAAAFVLSSVGLAASVAVAQVTPAQLKADGEKKDPAVADAAIAKDEAKEATKKAHVAKKKAHVAHKKAKAAAKKADVAAKDAAAPH